MPLIDERLELLKEKTARMKEGRTADAVALVRKGRGKELMDRISGLIDRMMEAEEKINRRREAEFSSASEASQGAFAWLAIVVVGVGLFVIYSSQRQLRALAAARDQLKDSYAEVLDEAKRRSDVETQLRQSQKLDALGQMTGGIAHDFNNMLAVIVASLNILRRKLKRGDSDYDQLIVSAEDAASSAARLVRRLLAFSRSQALAPRPINVNGVVSNAIELLKRTLGSNISIRATLPDEIWLTFADANELESAILNIGINARDAMPDGGELSIGVSNVELDERYAEQNVGVKAGQYVLIVIADTGEGMTPEVIEKAFDPFFTTKPVGKGTGLGLSQVHGFVKQLQGHVRIYSEPGRGTSIKIYLPRYSGDVETKKAVLSGERAAAAGSERVLLVVDDDPAARRVTAQAARELGHTVLEAEGGREAMEILKAHPEITLLITDVVMPKIDGRQLAREATFRRHDLKVLYVTGFPRDIVVHHGLGKDVALLMKPFTLDQLAESLHSILDAG